MSDAWLAGRRATVPMLLWLVLLCAGCSGSDRSRDELSARVPAIVPAGIYWVCQDPKWLLPAVREFLDNAEQAGVPVAIIRGCTFDELASDLADVTHLPATLTEHIFSAVARDAITEVPLTKEWASKTPVLRLSAIPVIQMPQTARRISLSKMPIISEVQGVLKNAGVWATVAVAGSSLAAFGKDDELLRALQAYGPSIAGEITLNPANDSWALGLLYDALAAAPRARGWSPRRRTASPAS